MELDRALALFRLIRGSVISRRGAEIARRTRRLEWRSSLGDLRAISAPLRETNPPNTQYQFVSKVGLSQPPDVVCEKRAVLLGERCLPDVVAGEA
jgi:hypothetical protein